MTKGYKKGVVCDLCGGPVGSRNKYGRCIGCRTAAFSASILYDHQPDPATMERILYYQQRAELGLDLFAESPWRRLPGAHNRLDEIQPEGTGATCRIAAADQIK